MPQRRLVAAELARFLGVLAHPNRVHIVEELRAGERDVNALQDALGISHSGVSQHLALLRANRVVAERRVGRRVFYRLLQPALAAWLTTGLSFIEPEPEQHRQMRIAVEQVRDLWNDEPLPPSMTWTDNPAETREPTVSIEPQEGT